MRVKITGFVTVSKKLFIPSSKSFSHRYIICSSLSKETSEIKNLLVSSDTAVTKNIFKKMGVFFKGDSITGVPNKSLLSINCKNSASTFRFLVPYLLFLEKKVVISMTKGLYLRPHFIYQELFPSILKKDGRFFIEGKINSGDFYIKENISSQFISGLLFTLPLLKGDSKVILNKKIESKNYVLMTIRVLKEYGIEIKEIQDGYFVKGNQEYHGVKTTIEGDYSSAAYFLCLGAIQEGIEISGLNPKSIQADFAIIEILKKFGVNINFIDDKLVVKKSNLNSTEIDLSECPDLGPILFSLAATIQGTTLFKGVERLKYKETNRIKMLLELQKLGIECYYRNGEIKITGKEEIKGDFLLSPHKDHRIAMALTILASKIKGSVVIKNSKCVLKSYPDFFSHYKTIGGIINEIKCSKE